MNAFYFTEILFIGVLNEKVFIYSLFIIFILYLLFMVYNRRIDDGE